MNMSENRITSTFVLSHLPMTRWVLWVTMALLAFFHLAIIALHITSNALLDQWLRSAKPAVDIVSHFVLAIGHVSRHMLKVGSVANIEIVRNVLAVHWIAYVGGFIAMFLACLADFLRAGHRASEAIYSKTRSDDRYWRYDTIVIGNFALASVGLFFGYTGDLYVQLALYSTDVSLGFSVVFFYVALRLLITPIALCIALVVEAMRKSPRRDPPAQAR